MYKRQGVITQGAATPGHYETRTYTVRVRDPGSRAVRRHRGRYHTETRSEQVWVAPVTPRPGMTQSAAPYIAGYTRPGRPASYALSSTTAAHPKAISAAAAGQLSAAASWTPASVNGSAQ